MFSIQGEAVNSISLHRFRAPLDVASGLKTSTLQLNRSEITAEPL
jgi:hypothetical protein